jgi:phosphate transport system protein
MGGKVLPFPGRRNGGSMRRHFAEEMEELRELVLRMGGLAEQMTRRSVQALVERRGEYLSEVEEMEGQVNRLHVEVDEAALEIIARRQPVGKDLRFLTSAMKINTDLERIGDQAVNIAGRTRSLLAVPPLKPLIDIPRMGKIAEGMLRDSLDAFVNGNDDLAYRTILLDDEVDNLKDQIFRELLTYMISDSHNIPRSMDLILVSRALERIGDHATNICEDVIFMVKGKDVRHQGPLA